MKVGYIACPLKIQIESLKVYSLARRWDSSKGLDSYERTVRTFSCQWYYLFQGMSTLRFSNRPAQSLHESETAGISAKDEGFEPIKQDKNPVFQTEESRNIRGAPEKPGRKSLPFNFGKVRECMPAPDIR